MHNNIERVEMQKDVKITIHFAFEDKEYSAGVLIAEHELTPKKINERGYAIVEIATQKLYRLGFFKEACCEDCGIFFDRGDTKNTRCKECILKDTRSNDHADGLD